MAETKKNTVKDGNAEKKVFIKLRRSTNPKDPQEEFFSFNFKNYLIKRGEEVEIPEGLAEMIKNNEASEEYAFRYSEEQQNLSESK